VLRGPHAKATFEFDGRVSATRGKVHGLDTPWASFIDGDVSGDASFFVERASRQRSNIYVDLEWVWIGPFEHWAKERRRA
jgi:hypothetical protein